MHFNKILSIFTLAAVGSGVLHQPQKQFLISFPQDTPQSELDQYKSAIGSAGGEILHEWEFIKGFIVKASSEALDTIKTFAAGQSGPKPNIEEDQAVTTQG